MAKPIPTRVGDVLILSTDKAYRVYAVGLVHAAGDQDFKGQENVAYLDSRADALKAAKALLAPGQKIFIRDIDTDEWSEISD